MSSRPLLKPQLVMNAASLGADAYSIVTTINMISVFSYAVSWTGSPTGQFNVEVSNDYVAPVGVQDYGLNSGTWVALVLSTTVSTGGTSGKAFIDIDTNGAAYVRLHYVRNSGSGTGTAWIAGKSA